MDVGMALLMQTTTANTFVMLKFLKHFLMFLCNIYYQSSNRKLLVLLISQRPFICSLWVLFSYVTLWDDHGDICTFRLIFSYRYFCKSNMFLWRGNCGNKKELSSLFQWWIHSFIYSYCLWVSYLLPLCHHL